MKKADFINNQALFSRGNDFEFLNHILYFLGYTDRDLNNKIAKQETLEMLRRLLKSKVMFIWKWEAKKELNNEKLTIDETIKHIDEIWFDGVTYPDFFCMVILGYQKWYVDALTKLGFFEATNWDFFVKEKIGDFDQWIEDNRPKD